LYHGADFNEPLGSRKLANDLHDARPVLNTQPILQDYGNLPSSDLTRNKQSLGLGGNQLGTGGLGNQLGTGGLGNTALGANAINPAICSTCRGIGKNLCSHLEQQPVNTINPELQNPVSNVTGFDKGAITNMPGG
jgi:hypothetical protein